MPRIPISQAHPGQKLTRPAATRGGMIMVQPGTELTAGIIERLKNLGIDSVSVEGPESASAKPLEQRKRELDERFQGHEHDQWMMDLKDIVSAQLAPDHPPAPHD